MASPKKFTELETLELQSVIFATKIAEETRAVAAKTIGPSAPVGSQKISGESRADRLTRWKVEHQAIQLQTDKLLRTLPAAELRPG